jgi:hypothetical protein
MRGLGFNCLILSCLMGIFKRGGASKWAKSGRIHEIRGGIHQIRARIAHDPSLVCPRSKVGLSTIQAGCAHAPSWVCPCTEMGVPMHPDGCVHAPRWVCPCTEVALLTTLFGRFQKPKWERGLTNSAFSSPRFLSNPSKSMNLNSAEMEAELMLHRMVTAWGVIHRRKAVVSWTSGVATLLRAWLRGG